MFRRKHKAAPTTFDRAACDELHRQPVRLVSHFDPRVGYSVLDDSGVVIYGLDAKGHQVRPAAPYLNRAQRRAVSRANHLRHTIPGAFVPFVKDGAK